MIIGVLTTGSISPKVGPYYYVGCYADQGSRGFSTWDSDQSTIVSCANQAKARSFKFFGLQNYQSNQGGISQCFLSNDLAAVTRYGTVSTCVAVNITNTLYQHGLGWTNAVYSLQPVAPTGMLITYKPYDDIHYF